MSTPWTFYEVGEQGETRKCHRERLSIERRKYSDELILEIREAAKTWTGSYAQLAAKFNVGISWARRVAIGKAKTTKELRGAP